MQVSLAILFIGWFLFIFNSLGLCRRFCGPIALSLGWRKQGEKEIQVNQSVTFALSVTLAGPDLAMWGPRAPSGEGAPKRQNKMRDLRQISKYTETKRERHYLNKWQS